MNLKAKREDQPGVPLIPSQLNYHKPEDLFVSKCSHHDIFAVAQSVELKN